MSRSQRRDAWLGLSLVMFSVLALVFPPPAAWLAPTSPDAGMLSRIFPGVPPWWVGGRLVCLLAGALLVAIGVSPVSVDSVADPSPGHDEQRRAGGSGSAPLSWIALLLAVLHATFGFCAGSFGRIAETVYFFFPIIPVTLLGAAELKPLCRLLRGKGKPLALLWGLPAVWLVYALVAAWRSPRAASVVDMWLMVERLWNVVLGNQKVLSSSAIPGLTNAYMMLEGVFLLGAGKLPLSFAYVQFVHVLWTALSGLGVGLVAWRFWGVACASVAQAVFLFSPLVLSFAYNPGGVYVLPLCTLLLFLLWIWFEDHGSPAAVVGFGAVAGFSVGVPQLTLVAGVITLRLLVSLRRRPRPHGAVLGAAVFSGMAAMIPGFPDLGTLAAAAREFTFGTAQIAGIESIFFGQRTALTIKATMVAGQPGLFDVPIGALLAPFAVARTPIRLLGDTLFDPFGAGLLAIGMVACLTDRGRRRKAGMLFAILGAGSIVGLTSGGDTVSHTRLAPTLIPLAIFAGIGFQVVRELFAAGQRVKGFGLPVAVLVAAAGLTVFHAVNIRILPASWQTIALEALEGAPSSSAVLLDYPMPFLQVARIADLLPAQPLGARGYCELESPKVNLAESRVHLWSPALEADAEVSCTICEHWPQAALYTLKDDSGLYRAFAASPQGGTWVPRLPEDRWSATYCRTRTIDDRRPSYCHANECDLRLARWPDPADLDRLHCAAFPLRVLPP